MPHPSPEPSTPSREEVLRHLEPEAVWPWEPPRHGPSRTGALVAIGLYAILIGTFATGFGRFDTRIRNQERSRMHRLVTTIVSPIREIRETSRGFIGD